MVDELRVGEDGMLPEGAGEHNLGAVAILASAGVLGVVNNFKIGEDANAKTEHELKLNEGEED